MLTRPDFKHKQILFLFTNQGERLSFKNDNLIIQDENKKIKHQSTCYRLFTLFVVGNISLTSGLIQRAKKFQFSIILMSHNLKPYACINAQIEGNVLLRSKQYNYQQTDIARHIVKNKLQMQKYALNRIRAKTQKNQQAQQKITQLLQTLIHTPITLQDLLNIEGQAAKSYFKAMYDNTKWQGRKPRTKIDPTNTLLDIGYTLLFNMIEALLNLYGFDLYKGVYHQVFYQRKSLVCDLMEPARPIIDYRIRKAISLEQIDLDDFDQRQGQYILFGKKAAPYSAFLLTEILHYKESLFLYIQRYYRAFMQDKAIEQYPIFTIENHVKSKQ